MKLKWNNLILINKIVINMHKAILKLYECDGTAAHLLYYILITVLSSRNLQNKVQKINAKCGVLKCYKMNVVHVEGHKCAPNRSINANTWWEGRQTWGLSF